MGGWNRLPILTKSTIVMALIYTGVKMIQPPLPSSLVTLYMALTAITIWMYLSLYDEKMEEFVGPIKTFFRGWTGENFGVTAARMIVLIAIPLYVGAKVHAGLSPSNQPPIEARVIHPAPPAEFMSLTNPVPRTKKNIATGFGLYVAFCTPCHGFKADGQGLQRKGFDPPPANFTDVGTIAQLQESYLFWRIKKGGPGLPVEGMPWKSAMPRWETRISDENIWKIIMYEYQLSGHKPRTWE